MSKADFWKQAYGEEVLSHDATRRLNLALCERVQQQSELLSKRAEGQLDGDQLTAAYHDLCAVLGWAVDEKPATAEMVARAARAIVKQQVPDLALPGD